MFESLLKNQELEKNDWMSVMPGVSVCDFEGRFPETPRLELSPNHYETVFCQGGTVHLRTASGQNCYVQKGDILLISDVSKIQSLSFSTGQFQGILVTVTGQEAKGSLAQICSMLGELEVDVRQVGQLMRDSGGCACIHGELWSEALFLAMTGLPPEERGRYCALKAVELLYLLCRGGFDLSRTWMEHCSDRCKGEIARQVNDYIQSHLAEDLTIGQLSKRFHCSPTALKLSFRQSYGLPVHRYVTACRLRRGAELLDTTTFSVLQIAAEVGYSSTSQFSTMFKRRYQLTPGEYRYREEKSETDGHPV